MLPIRTWLRQQSEVRSRKVAWRRPAEESEEEKREDQARRKCEIKWRVFTNSEARYVTVQDEADHRQNRRQ